jgi:hypothetical protein
MSFYNDAYHRKVMKQVLDEYRQNPDINYDFENMSGFKGGSQYRFKPSKWVKLDPEDDYYQDGTVAQTPYLNEIELRKMNKMEEPYRYFQGSGKKSKKQSTNKRGGKITKKDIISGVLDVLPAVAGIAPLALGPEMAPLAPIAGLVVDKARRVLKKKTGYGKAKTAKKVAKASISALLDIVPTAIATSVGSQTDIGPYNKPLTSAITQRQLQILRDKVKQKTGLGFTKKFKLQYNHPSYYKILDNLITNHPQLWQGGKINQRSITMVKNGLLPILKVGAQGVLDFVIPEGLEYVGAELGLPPKTGRLIGNFIRQTIRHKTGFGKKSKIQPEAKGIKQYTGGKRVLSEKMKRRNNLIKKIMKEKGYNMIEASKYIANQKIAY